MIIVSPLAGLGNRLYAFASAYEISKRHQRKLLVLWSNDGSFAVNMKDVLDVPKDIKVINVTENSFIKAPLRVVFSKIVFWACKRNHKIYNIDDEKVLTHDDIQNHTIALAEQDAAWYFRTWMSLIPEAEIDYHCIRPSESVKKRGAQLFDRIQSGTYGIHIRRADHVESIANSPLELFEKKIEEILEKEKNATFYLATDDPETKQILRKKYGECILIHEQAVISRKSKAGCIDAAVEMFALSKCKKIYGSYKSTYSQLAAFIGGTELEVIKS